ncbi:MAG TPA: NAD(P)/FAD-dependent oxidoreductase [Xanthobacteraceae bacterium]|nr:NAD(P)/FAD-dependent oxidoreductase [Xanthobacteraceae bacterium]
MKSFLVVKFALVPFAVFFALVARGMPGWGLGAALLLSLAIGAWRLYARDIKRLEVAALVIFAALAAAYAASPAFVGTHAVALSFLGLGLFALVTVALRKPWTADFSRATYPGADASPIFTSVNMVLSALWGVLFVLLALASALKLGAVVSTGIVIVGAVATIVGPRVLVQRALARKIASGQTYHWPAPRLGGAEASDFDVAVVGAGIGGLTAAALLADAGMKVVVAEQQRQPGGFCQTFRRRARRDDQVQVFRFDAGPHTFSGVWPGGPVTSMLERLGVAQRLEWRRFDHSYRDGDLALDIPRDWHDYVRELGRRFPSSARGFESLFAAIRTIYEGMYSPLISSGGIPALGLTVDSMQAFARQHPAAVRWLDRPFAELVAEHIADPRARRIVSTLAFYISDGSAPLTCAQMVPLFGYYFYGGHYPIGGSGRFADALVAAIEERKGELWLNAPVKQIAVENGRAAGLVLADGRRVAAAAVVSNADLKRTYLDLVEARNLPVDFRRQIADAEPACSAYTVHLGIDFVPDIKPAVHVLDERRIGLVVTSLIDPTAAPEGHASLSIITLLPHAEAEQWFPSDAGGDDGGNDDKDYDKDYNTWRQSPLYGERKKAFADRLIAAAETLIPDLSGHIVCQDAASPVTFARYDGASLGSIYGVMRSAQIRGAKSPVPGLVAAGSSAHGAGVEAVVISGAFAADALCPGLLSQSPSTESPARAA